MSDLITRSRGVQIEAGSIVTLHFSLLLESGEEVDTTRRGSAATCQIGDGQLLPGFEIALIGLEPGDDQQIRLAPCDAFGETHEKHVQVLPKKDFAGMALEPGLIVSFASPSGELPGVVKTVFEQTVAVDFNHPLSGKVIIFDVSILNVEPPPAVDQ